MHCYFLLNIKYGASQLYLGAQGEPYVRPRGEGPLKGPQGGLQLSIAGTALPQDWVFATPLKTAIENRGETSAQW